MLVCAAARAAYLPGVGQDESEMAVEAATKGGGNRSGIGLDLGGESLQSFIHGLAMYSRQHLVLEVSVVDTGDPGGHAGQARE